MSIKVVKINDEVIKPIQLGKGKKEKPVKGAELFPEKYGLYGNILLLGKKFSGKTSVINYILEKCVGKKTHVIIFAATAYNDDNWIYIREHFEEKEIKISVFQSMFNERRENILDNIVNELQAKAKKDEEDKKKEPLKQMSKLILVDSEDDEEDEEEKDKSKYQAPEYIFVFDDLSNEIEESKELTTLLKKNRHFKSKVIISTQYYTDVPSKARQQLNFMLLFPALPDRSLKELWKSTGLSIEFEVFDAIYKSATREPFNFLYVDITKGKYRHNFNKEIVIKNI